MATTIQISDDLQKALNSRKIFSRETYEEVIWDLMEDSMELNEETKRDIERARKEMKKGNYVTLEQIEKENSL